VPENGYKNTYNSIIGQPART